MREAAALAEAVAAVLAAVLFAAEALAAAEALVARFLVGFAEAFFGDAFEAFLVGFFALIQLALQISADRTVLPAADRELQELHGVRIIGEHLPL